MTQTIPQYWSNFLTRIKALYGNEFFQDKSNRDDYDYLAIHYHWYNRYAESVRLCFLLFSVHFFDLFFTHLLGGRGS
jgi:hypothetical protein